jgi:GrpB-like predicted nucleotidyltransferase (UPF0157 family)/quercetin dioxygenase-like cupin family protein
MAVVDDRAVPADEIVEKDPCRSSALATHEGIRWRSDNHSSMEIFRFDDEVAVPINSFGSRFRLGHIVQATDARVSVMHLPAGGSVGEHEAVGPQLFAVMAGSGWVSGAAGRRRRLSTGWAALWEAAELHAAGTDDGLTALCVEGTFLVRARTVTRDIEVTEYNPEWPRWFEEIRDYIGPAVAGIAVRIDHIGSTAVPGLAGKPIIDLDVVVSSEQDVPKAIEALARIGYIWSGDLGVVGREHFERPAELVIPRHNLYLVVEDNKAHVDHWLLRDVLRTDADARARYAAIKIQNARDADRDMDYYVAAKAAFVADLLTSARVARGLPEAEYWEPDMSQFDQPG